jgi:2-polyprenyl-3-methyl-5-hydroxy-6-metoxy-1,4-benzoquinol methylase
VPDEKEQLQRSWIANAPAWRDAVRERKIDSRRVATDAAIIDAVMSLGPESVLDLGCGEGWLARELSSRDVRVVGVDASRPLIDAAEELGGGSFYAISYEELIAAHAKVGAPFDVVVANFSILEEDIRPIFTAAAGMLKDDGAFVIQTVHPAFAVGEAPYVSGWRTETFAAIDGEWPEPMPWYFRTLGEWVHALSENGFVIGEVREPLDARQYRPLSMIFVCRRALAHSE